MANSKPISEGIPITYAEVLGDVDFRTAEVLGDVDARAAEVLGDVDATAAARAAARDEEARYGAEVCQLLIRLGRPNEMAQALRNRELYQLRQEVVEREYWNWPRPGGKPSPKTFYEALKPTMRKETF